MLEGLRQEEWVPATENPQKLGPQGVASSVRRGEKNSIHRRGRKRAVLNGRAIHRESETLLASRVYGWKGVGRCPDF